MTHDLDSLDQTDYMSVYAYLPQIHLAVIKL
jgi:hypothetical protein